MLYIVLVLVLAAFGLLIAALTTANTLWAWISVAVSVVAAALLIMDWLGGRRRAAESGDAAKPAGVDEPASPEPPPIEPAPTEARSVEPPPAEVAPAGPATERPPLDSLPAEPTLAERPPLERSPAESPPFEAPAETTLPTDDLGDPGEEPTDAADLLIVAGLSVEVRVVDEHPRYHLAACTWLAGQATIPIAVSEARQLGFTPCVRCGPDAQLAAKHRADR